MALVNQMRTTAPTQDNQIVWSVVKIIAAAGLIGAVLYFSVVSPMELLNFFAYLMLPCLLILLALRVVSTETMKMVWNGELQQRVESKYNELVEAAKTSGRSLREEVEVQYH